MTKYQTDDLRIVAIKEVIAPETLLNEYPLSEFASETVATTRSAIHDILDGKDDRLLVIIGPCSIHDPKAALEYASRLKKVRDELKDDLLIVMRVYFEKPRTTVGWKGLINDPHLNGSFDINTGLRTARKVLVDINELGVPAGCEYLDLITPQYLSDLVSWGAIGARTTESQSHRELASGLSCPVGFKNGTDGNIKIAVDAIGAASQPHYFMSLTKSGHSAIFGTSGNPYCHVILRGGNKLPNYDAEHVSQTAEQLVKAGQPARIMIDFSHANSLKQHQKQLEVATDVASQLADGERRIMGVMVESHLVAGRQDVDDVDDLVFGQSITDACIDWDHSVPLLKQLAEAVRERRQIKQTAIA